MIEKKILFQQSHLDYVDYFGRKQNLASTSQAVRTIIDQHQLYLSKTEGSVSQLIAEVLEEKYSALFKSIKLAVNNTDRNSQILIELFNSLLFAQGIDSATPTEIYITPPLAKAQEIIQERIANQNQKKWSDVGKV
ncbi:MAG: hypothetical protein HFJ84_11230 [Clostridiales bacterium]|nr:hypothetical protein [Clostridiales bacterium]